MNVTASGTPTTELSPATPADAPIDTAARRRLAALARRWLGAGPDVQDLVQEVCLRVATGQPPAGDAGREAWSTTVLRHLCIDLLRRRGRHDNVLAREAAALPPHDDASPERLLEQAQRVEAALAHLVDQLPPEDAAAVLLHEVFDLGHAELGAMLGRSEAASRQYLSRALRRLRGTPARRRPEAPTADDDAAALLAVCRHALAQRDPAGLVALLRSGQPLPVALRASAFAMRALFPARAAGAQAADASSAQLVQVQGRLALAVCLGGQFLCLLPLDGGVTGEAAEAVETVA